MCAHTIINALYHNTCRMHIKQYRFTWTTNTCILVMTTGGHSISVVGTVEQIWFFSNAANTGKHDVATALPIVSISPCQSSCECNVVASGQPNYCFSNSCNLTNCGKTKLSADHTCIAVTPPIITDSAPGSIHTYFHSPLSAAWSSIQSNLSICATTPASYWLVQQTYLCYVDTNEK